MNEQDISLHETLLDSRNDVLDPQGRVLCSYAMCSEVAVWRSWRHEGDEVVATCGGHRRDVGALRIPL